MEAPAAQRLIRAVSVEIVELAGIKILKILVMVNTKKEFPREYTDQVISSRNAATAAGRRAPGPGLKFQAASHKHQASSAKRQASQPE